MILRRTVLSLLSVFALLPALSLPAVAAEDPMETMNAIADYTRKTIGNPAIALNQRHQYSAAIIDQRFDTATLGRLALGNTWRRLNANDRAAFLSKFRDVMVEEVLYYFSDTASNAYQITGGKRDRKDPKTVHIAMRMQRSNGQWVDTSWRVVETGGIYKVLDIEIEGLSLLSQIRGEYRQAYSEGGFNSLIRFMDRRIRQRRAYHGG